MTPLLQQQLDFDLARLTIDFPPVWRHPHKQAIHDRVRREGGPLTGTLRYTRWQMAPLPQEMNLHACEVRAEAGFFTYTESNPGIWHMNFADPRLFAAYGSPLMAQDEWQVLEHPALASLREAMLRHEPPALTRENGISTPVLIVNAPRQCCIDLSGSATSARPWWSRFLSSATPQPLYGNAFASATQDAVLHATTVLNPPIPSHIIALAAPTGTGVYTPRQITDILQTAFSGFSAAVIESARHGVPSAQITIHTGWWGCGAFGGNRTLMALLQTLAAKMAAVGRLVFHIGGERERCHFTDALSFLDLVTAQGTTSGIPAIISEIEALNFHWGQSDGN
ncbi:hypothetical protein [Prosthecobacter sp.]|uniref:hypothetical protein n=1 Tax=Prosthecobacter sp. TaxID=1965333 RepID=UPI0037837388